MPPTTVLRPTYNQVTKQNLTSLQPIIIQLLKQADFLALDAEFTGLGPKAAATRASDIQERYKNMCRLAGTHALVAFGLSIFIRTSPSPAKATDSTRAMDLDNDSKEEQKEKLHSNEKISYRVHNFNFSMLSEEDYMVSPNSMIFLAENGLDLNQWVQEGIPYKAGDRLKNDGGRGNPNGIMRSIFKRIMSRGVPVVVHNGFLDIVFLYHSFYADLPASLQTFVADMSDMFPGGLYDTKYGSDYITRERSSFLAYLYRKYQRFDLRAAEQHRNQLSISKSESIDHDPMDGTQNNESNFQSEPSQSTTPAVSSDPEPTLYSSFDVQPQLVLPAMPDLDPPVDNSVAGSTGIKICEDYAYHGVCKKNMRCGRSHDLDLILDAEEEERDSKKRKRRKTAETEVAAPPPTLESEPHKVDSQVQTVQPVSESLQTTATTSTTATAVAPEPSETRAIERSLPELSVTESGRLPSEKFHSAYFDAFMTGTIFAHQMNIHSRSLIEIQARNKIYLIGKSFPLKIEKSVFSKFSPSHERQRVL